MLKKYTPAIRLAVGDCVTIELHKPFSTYVVTELKPAEEAIVVERPFSEIRDGKLKHSLERMELPLRRMGDIGFVFVVGPDEHPINVKKAP